jgi:TonB family protein
MMLLCVFAVCAPKVLAQKPASGRKLVFTTKPDYPSLLRYQQIGGLVRLVATVLPDGKVSKVEIRGGNPILAESASTAVMKWRYAPAAFQTSEEVSISFSPH